MENSTRVRDTYKHTRTHTYTYMYTRELLYGCDHLHSREESKGCDSLVLTFFFSINGIVFFP
jgi:hypothetical protein